MPVRARLLGLAGALAVAGLLFAGDAGSKAWAEENLRRHGARSILGGQLTLRYQTNSGMAFGLFQAQLHPSKRAWVISYGAVMTAGLAAVLGWVLLSAQVARPALAAAGVRALLAGSAGNLRDQIVRGAVIDYNDLHPAFLPDWNWPAANLADLYLAIGLVLCVWALLARPRRAPASLVERTPQP